MKTVSAKILSKGYTNDGRTLDGDTIYIITGIGPLHLMRLELWAKDELAQRLWEQLQTGWIVGITYEPSTHEILGLSGLTQSDLS